jgi:hypothetical protein
MLLVSFHVCTIKRAQSSALCPRQTPSLLALADKVQSINRSCRPHRTTTSLPPSAAHPSTTTVPPLSRDIIACAHPSPAAAAARPRPPCGVLEALCLPSSIQGGHPSNSGLPTEHIARTSVRAIRLPAKLVGRHQTLSAAAARSADRRNLGGRERAHFLYHCRTLFHLISLSHLHPSLHHHHTAPPPILSASPSAVASAPSRPRCHLLTSPVLLRSVPCESFPRFGHKRERRLDTASGVAPQSAPLSCNLPTVAPWNPERLSPSAASSRHIQLSTSF